MTDTPAATYRGPAVLLCVACRAHCGFWPPDDARCPGCRSAGRVAEPEVDQ